MPDEGADDAAQDADQAADEQPAEEGEAAPRFAVVVPTYNAEEHIDECLDSLWRLEEPAGGFEVLVVDGGSSDGTVAVAEELGARVLEAPGTGVAEARNRAAEATHAEVLVFVDADCRAPPRMLVEADHRLETNAVVGAFYEPAREHGWISRTWLAIERKPAGPVAWVPAGTLAIQREAFEAVGRFTEELQASEDVELCRRLRNVGYTVYHEPAMACEHLGQPDTLGSFFANEVGRSASLVESVREADGLDAEHATLAFALAYLIAPFALFAAALAGPLWVAIVLAAILAPTLAWSLYAASQAGWRWLPTAFALLAVYNVARAVSLIKHGQWRELHSGE